MKGSFKLAHFYLLTLSLILTKCRQTEIYDCYKMYIKNFRADGFPPWWEISNIYMLSNVIFIKDFLVF